MRTKLAVFSSGCDQPSDSIADVLAVASDDGTTTAIDLGGGNSLTLANVLVSELHQDDFLF